MKRKSKSLPALDKVIGNILEELNKEHAMYQNVYTKYYGDKDEKAGKIHDLLVKLCDRIRREVKTLESTS